MCAPNRARGRRRHGAPGGGERRRAGGYQRSSDSGGSARGRRVGAVTDLPAVADVGQDAAVLGGGDSEPVHLPRLHAETNLADVAYTLQVGRKRLEHRRAVVCSGVADALAALEGTDGQRVMSSYQPPRKKSVAFLFAGVGDHYVDMGAELYEAEEEFRTQVDRCCDVWQPLLGVDLRR